MGSKKFLFSSESVTEGHPDKICDQISDAVLDDVLRQDTSGRVACETFVTVGLVMVGGEITTRGYVDLPVVVREVIREIGYDNPALGFHYQTCALLNVIGKQSPDIAQGVDTGGAGDQGLMTGYASRETPELMPMPIMLSHKLCQKLAEARKNEELPFLGPDGKSQVTVEYVDGRPKRIDSVVIATQHTEEILDYLKSEITPESRQIIREKIVDSVIPEDLMDEQTRFYINQTGKFVIGGPVSDTGMTGRKVIVDTYGGMATHGGGAFSGKDPTKVDRSAAYMARYVAKNIVAAEIAEKCQIQLAYVIGRADPVSINVFTDPPSEVPPEKIEELVRKHFQLTPQGMIEQLDLLRPIYRKTAAYGHFGRELEEFTWERTDIAKDLARDV
ncbi:MAG: methionine adenosyltransferase [candidate division Zixibacteria bacterium]|jgi:S-adenosylmethionine synthetase|nr:methionine adenosyltransferase [candidate division Zixibacteria bacterium]